MSSELPAAYFDTVFVLQKPLDPLPSHFAIITGFNPMDNSVSIEINEAADKSLKFVLDRSMLEAFRATGCSPDRSHQEPGWAFSCDLKNAIKVARTFRQRAIWWIENDTLYLVNCESEELTSIDHFSDRVARE